eukprot:COSAG03_NODE_21660_length_301_cov_1.009901_1_plen_31_part_10
MSILVRVAVMGCITSHQARRLGTDLLVQTHP